MGVEPESTTGLTSRTASVLSYLGWWITGLIFWGLERRDPLVRFHAAQATITFGALALVIALLVLLGLFALSFAPRGFTVLVTAAALVWALGVALWVMALWQASRGRRWRIPLAAPFAERWSRTSRTSPSASS